MRGAIPLLYHFYGVFFIGTVLGDAEDVGSGILVQEINILFVGLEVRFMRLLLLQLNFKKMYI
jgi:hypothetical protein